MKKRLPPDRAESAVEVGSASSANEKELLSMKTILRFLFVPVLVIAAWIPLGWAADEVVLVTDADGVQRATMTVDSYSYKPDHLVVRTGIPVELILVSQTTFTPHNFVLKQPDAGMVVNEDIGPGDTVKVRFTPSKPGVFAFYCDKKLLFFKSHREKGMEGVLKVQ
jgi:plastocyanin